MYNILNIEVSALIQAKWSAGIEDLAPVLHARRILGKEEKDDQDLLAWHLTVTEDGVPCGVLRLYADDGRFHLDKILSGGKSYEDLMIRMAILKLDALNVRSVYAHLPKKMYPFWLNYGFSLVPSDEDSKQVTLLLTNPSLPPSACGKQSGDCD